jgi:hypothetical protein
LQQQQQQQRVVSDVDALGEGAIVSYQGCKQVKQPLRTVKLPVKALKALNAACSSLAQLLEHTHFVQAQQV